MNEDDADGFKEGMQASTGDPRVLLVMNAVLSTLFSWSIVWGLSLLGVAEFTAINVATGAIILFSLTYLVSMS